MRKLLLAVGNVNPNATTYDFASYLARVTNSNIKGIFLEPLKQKPQLISVAGDDEVPLQAFTDTNMPENKIFSKRYERQIEHFHNAFDRRDIKNIAHEEHSTPWKALLDETRFADALILDPNFVLHDQQDENMPSHDTKRLLHEAECPVIIAPLTFNRIDEIIFTYDGGKSSVYAMRQFMFLFPALKDIKVTVLEIEPDGKEADQKEQQNITEWLKMHFTKVETAILEGDPTSRLLEYMLGKTNAFVVLGGFGRSKWSRLLQPSASKTLTEIIPAPLFIAHT